MKEIIQRGFHSHLETIEKTIYCLQDEVWQASQIIVEALKCGNKLLVCRSSGSSTDISALTTIDNNYGYEKIYDKQIVESLASEEDVPLAISTSGKSINIINAFNIVKKWVVKLLIIATSR